jgi:hypothetical protein
MAADVVVNLRAGTYALAEALRFAAAAGDDGSCRADRACAAILAGQDRVQDERGRTRPAS